jgi:hypothetical protein
MSSFTDQRVYNQGLEAESAWLAANPLLDRE